MVDFSIKGKVVEGKKRGRLLGFPTANVYTDLEIPEGIYASEVMVDGKKYRAATFVGSPKTFGEEDFKVESYILNFNNDIYGMTVEIYLYKKIRGNKKFSSEDALISQMEEDVQRIISYFSED